MLPFWAPYGDYLPLRLSAAISSSHSHTCLEENSGGRFFLLIPAPLVIKGSTSTSLIGSLLLFFLPFFFLFLFILPIAIPRQRTRRKGVGEGKARTHPHILYPVYTARMPQTTWGEYHRLSQIGNSFYTCTGIRSPGECSWLFTSLIPASSRSIKSHPDGKKDVCTYVWN